MKTAPPKYSDLYNRVVVALDPPTLPKAYIIGIDGRDGAGKSALAAWLAWQLGYPAVFLDMFVVPESRPLTWCACDLVRVLDSRRKRPVIVEGVLILDALEQVGRKPNFLVYVEKLGNKGSYTLRNLLKSYLHRRRPKSRADYVLRWREPALALNPEAGR
jgi:hypothetical protein